MEDPYKALGVARDASQDDIRRAYRDLAKRHHPDLNPGNVAAEERFKTVAAANELLSDPVKRGQFDRGEIDAAGQARPPQQSYRHYAEGEPGRRYAPGQQGGGWTEADLQDIFGSMFDEGRPSGAKTPARGTNEHYILATSFLESVNGALRRLTLPDGRTLDVKIPPGTMDGQKLRLRGQGRKGGNGGTDGDALIEIHVAAHAYFSRDGQDVRLELPVSLAEAVLGGPVEVPTPGGPVRMQIPPHADTGTELRLRGRGVPAHGGKPVGDLYARLRVVIGAPDPALDAFLRGWTPDNPTNPRRAMEAGSVMAGWSFAATDGPRRVRNGK